MSLLGSAVLVNWGGIIEAKENEYNRWHSEEHMPERISLPGFIRGLRAVGIKETKINNKYFMMYEAERKEVFVSQQYLERLNNPTNWTKDILSNYISPSRTICSVVFSSSLGKGGCISTIRFLNNVCENQFGVEKFKFEISNILNLEGILGVHFLLGDNNFGQLKTVE